MTHNGKNDGFMQDAPDRREDDEDKEYERLLTCVLSPINKKLSTLESEMGWLKGQLAEIHNALNGFISERGALSQLDLVESKQETLAEKLKSLNKEIEGLKAADNTALIVQALDLMGRLETKIDRM